MKKIFLFLICFAVLSACDDDGSSNSNLDVDDKMFVGEWVWPNSSGTCFTDIEMMNSKQAFYAVYNNKAGNSSGIVKDNGSWRLFANRNVLTFQFLYDTPPFYEIVEYDDTRIVFRNEGYNTIDTYYRVVEALNINAGQTVAISYLQDHPGSVRSCTPEIADVDADGNIYGILDGVAFIEINADGKIAYAKVIVQGRTERFKAETHMLSDDIKARYGEPSYEGLQSNGMMAMQYKYPQTADPAIAILQYWFHPTTHQMYRVQTVYFSEEDFQRDGQYISNNFILQDMEPYNIYGENERYWENEYIMSVVGKSGDYYWINYLNLDYNDL